MNFAPFVLASSITSFLLLTFVRFHAENFSIFPIPCPLLPLLRGFSWLGGKGIIYEPNCNAVVNCLLFLQYGLQDDSVKILPYEVW